MDSNIEKIIFGLSAMQLFWTFIVAIIACYLVGKFADKTGHSFGKFFWISFFLTPIIGFLWVYVTGENIRYVESRKISSQEFKRCSYCDELIRHHAKVCKHCGKDIVKSKHLLSDKDSVCMKCGEKRANAAFKKCLKCGWMFPS